MTRAWLAALLLAAGCAGAPPACPACPACEASAPPASEAPAGALFVRVEGPRGAAEATMPPEGASERWAELMERAGMSRIRCDAARAAADRWTVACWLDSEGRPLGSFGPRFFTEIACSATPRDGFHGSVEVVDERLTPVRPEHPHGREAQRAVVRARCEP